MKSKPSKIVYKVYEVFCICRDVFFEEDVEKEPGNFMAEYSKCEEWYHRKWEVVPKEVFHKPNATLRGNVAFIFDNVCIQHFLFRKS